MFFTGKNLVQNNSFIFHILEFVSDYPQPTGITISDSSQPKLHSATHCDLSVDEEDTAAERTSDSYQPSTSNSVQKPAAKERNPPSFNQPEVKKSKRRVRPHKISI
jgi:hypothetical protein